MLTAHQREARRSFVIKLRRTAWRLGTTIKVGSNLLGLVSGIVAFVWTGDWWLVLRIFASLVVFVVVGTVWTYGGLHLLDTMIWPRIERKLRRTVGEHPEFYGDPEDEPESWALGSEQ